MSVVSADATLMQWRCNIACIYYLPAARLHAIKHAIATLIGMVLAVIVADNLVESMAKVFGGA